MFFSMHQIRGNCYKTNNKVVNIWSNSLHQCLWDDSAPMWHIYALQLSTIQTCQTCSLFCESVFVIWLAYAGDRLEIDKPSSSVRWSLALSAMTASVEREMGQSDKWSTDNGLSPVRQCVLFLCCLWSWLAPLARTQWCWEVLAGICETGQSLELCSGVLNISCHIMLKDGSTVFLRGVKISVVKWLKVILQLEVVYTVGTIKQIVQRIFFYFYSTSCSSKPVCIYLFFFLRKIFWKILVTKSRLISIVWIKMTVKVNGNQNYVDTNILQVK